MDANLKNFLEQKKNLITDTKIPGAKKQKTMAVKPGKGMMDKPIESDPHKRMVKAIINDKPSKKDVIEKFQGFIEAAEAEL